MPRSSVNRAIPDTERISDNTETIPAGVELSEKLTLALENERHLWAVIDTIYDQILPTPRLRASFAIIANRERVLAFISTSVFSVVADWNVMNAPVAAAFLGRGDTSN